MLRDAWLELGLGLGLLLGFGLELGLGLGLAHQVVTRAAPGRRVGVRVRGDLHAAVGVLLAAVLGGMGIAMYAGLWLLLPADSRFEQEPPGLASATRGGRRPGRSRHGPPRTGCCFQNWSPDLRDWARLWRGT